jgi:hypothetical protein
MTVLLAAAAAAAPLVHAFECTMPPGGYSEVDLATGRATRASARFESDGALDWNVHAHAHHQVTYLDRGRSKPRRAARIEHRAEGAAAFSFMWENRSDKPATFKVEVRGEDVRLVSYASCYAPKKAGKQP